MLIGFHSDLTYEDSGLQKTSDTSSAVPIVTLSVGSTRTLTFRQNYKTCSCKKWHKEQPSSPELQKELEHGSVFVLLEYDEKPKKNYRT